MAKTVARTPSATKSAINKGSGRRPNPKHIEMYAKTVTIPLTGSNPEQLQAVAKAAHQAVANHEHVLGGKKKRSVFVGKSDSITPKKIFDGTILPDSIS